MLVQDLFPKCNSTPCPLGGTGRHSHILPKQQEVLDSPERVVALVGGYGSLAGETLIKGVPLAEWQGGPVATLLGEGTSLASYVEGRAALYRVTTRSGSQVVAMLGHRFLTPFGWRPLGSLAVGAVIGASVSEDVVHSLERQSDWMGRYSGWSHLHGEQLRHALTLSQDTGQRFYRPSIVESCTEPLPHPSKTCWLQGELPQPLVVDETLPRMQEPGELSPLTQREILLPHELGAPFGKQGQHLPIGSGGDSFERTLTECHDLCTGASPYTPTIPLWDEVVNIQFVREGEFYDFSVPGPAHFEAHGLWHHNSAKTLAGMALVHLLMTSIPGNMGIVVRRSLPKLRDSTQRIYLEVLDRSKADVEFREMRDGWPGRIIYRDNGSEVTFRETKDLGRFLGPEYGVFAIDEAQEEPETTFKNLLGRLRLPRANRYLKALLMTNPPRRGHWIQKRFPKEGSWFEQVDVNGVLVKVTFRMVKSRTADNPFLDAEYIAQLRLTHTAEELRGILSGEYRTDFDGKPVYRPPFNPGLHVGSFPILKMTVARGWDFGYHHPVVTYHQMPRCTFHRPHWRILRELIVEDVDYKELHKAVIEHGQVWFPDHNRYMFIDAGDAAGAAASDKGPGAIIQLAQPPYNLPFRYTAMRDIDPSVRFIRELLRTKCQCGHYMLEVDRECPEVIEALSGGYHFPKDKSGMVKPDAKPVKDGYYDNIADSVRYTGWNLYRAARQDESFMAELEKWQGPEQDPLIVDPGDFKWMGDMVESTTSQETWDNAYAESRMMQRR